MAGWVAGDGGLTGSLGAVIVAVHDASGTLRYAGRVGSGFSDTERIRMQHGLEALSTPSSPISGSLPPAVAKVAHHVRPELVVEVAFAEWTADGVLRHPSYIGQRYDLNPAEVRREEFPGDPEQVGTP